MTHPLKHILPAPAIDLMACTGSKDIDFCGMNSEDDRITEVEWEIEKLYPYLGHGGSRNVYDGGAVVYKLGCPDTCRDEVLAYEQYVRKEHEIPIAKCRLVYSVTGVPIVVMETVLPASRHDEDIPGWARVTDSVQVGKTLDGEWVTFDAPDLLGASLLGCPVDTKSGISPRERREKMMEHPIPAIFAA